MTALAQRRAPDPEPDQDRLALRLAAFAPPSEELLAGRELLRRIDSKFVVRRAVIDELLAGLDRDYAAFKVASGSIADYHSLYFDTPELTCFHDHRRGRRLRHKVRIRHYPDRDVSYLEVKSKRSELVTHKHRLRVPYRHEALGDEQVAFMRRHIGALADVMRPEVRINYRRIGLLGLRTAERVTIDLGLHFVDLDDQVHPMGDVAVVELKQSGSSRTTPIARRLAAAGLREQSLSKYTTAIALTRTGVRRNRLLPDLKAVERILR